MVDRILVVEAVVEKAGVEYTVVEVWEDTDGVEVGVEADSIDFHVIRMCSGVVLGSLVF